MKIPVCAVYDRKINMYDAIFTLRHPGEAIRQWDIVRKNTDTKYGRNPEDFCLRQLAWYNEQTGEISECKPPIDLADGV